MFLQVYYPLSATRKTRCAQTAVLCAPTRWPCSSATRLLAYLPITRCSAVPFAPFPRGHIAPPSICRMQSQQCFAGFMKLRRWVLLGSNEMV